jgi:hypothetical protein
MKTIYVQLEWDNDQTRHAEAESAKVEGGLLILRDASRDEIGRFQADKIRNWWISAE